MIRQLIIVITFISVAFMQGKIAGYAIFDWSCQEDGMNDFDITRTYFQYTDDVSENLYYEAVPSENFPLQPMGANFINTLTATP